MNLSKLGEILKNEPAYRIKQAKQAVFKDLIDDWQKAMVFSVGLRKILNENCSLKTTAENFTSKDKNTAKALITLKDNLQTECVLMKHKGRNTVCVSSQIGCPLACSFCATGKIGFKRNLTSDEIVEQVIHFARLVKNSGEKITSIVFMGMGEPFLNYENVLNAIKTLNDKDGFNLGVRHFSISTAGITEGIKKLADENMEINLAISLHAPTNELRSKIMPINKKYPIEKIFGSADAFIKKTRRRIMIEYVMIKDMNDSEECARQLIKLVKKPLYFVNLISYNPTCDFRPSVPEKINRFKDILEKAKVPVTQRFKFGKDINAACGQLIGK